MADNHSETERRLWAAADEFRANSELKSSEYATPVPGLIFLRYADFRFTQVEKEREGKGSGRRTIGKEDYQAKGVMHLPPKARFSCLLALPEGENIGKAINEAMNPCLMAMILNDPPTKGRLANYVTGAAIPRVILKDFRRFQILVPPADIQVQWHDRTASSIQLIHRLLRKNDNLRSTRDLLLPKLISGQPDVEDLDIDMGATAEEQQEVMA